MYQMDIIGHETAAPGPLTLVLSHLACHGRSARPNNFLNLTSCNTKIIQNKK